MDFLTPFLPSIQHLGMWGYWLVTLASFVESVAFLGTIFPGSILVAFAGFLSSQGYLDVGDLIWFSAVGAILGDGLSYYLGTKGTQLFKAENKILRIGHLEKGKMFFEKHGDKSVFFGRFIAPVRPIIPFIAGLSGMNRKKFFLWNILSAFLWAASHILVGYFFGGALKVIELWSTRIGILLAASALAVFIIWLAVKNMHKPAAFIKSISVSIWGEIVANPDMKKLALRHPKFFQFLRERTEIKDFYGLPLTVLCVALAYILLLFGGIVEDVLNSELITQADVRIENLLYVFRNIPFVKIFYWFTMLGEPVMIAVFAVIASIILWLYGRKFYIVSLWSAIIGAGLTAVLAKIIVHRPRPAGDIPLIHEGSYSFPSGHATMSMVFYGFLIYFFIRTFGRWRYKANLSFICLLVIFAIGFSRLYLGVHWLSDVLGGYLVGLIWLTIGITVAEWLSASFGAEKREIIGWRKTASLLMAVLAFFAYTVPAAYLQPKLSFRAEEPTYQTIDGDIMDLFSGDQLPKYSEGLVGEKREPIGFIIVAKDDDALDGAFERAGWYSADRVTLGSLYTIALKASTDEPYPTAPMTPAFWNAKVNDFNFEKPTASDSVRQRHHSRFWRTDFVAQDGSHIYVGTASLDTGIKWGITHTISPDLDTEKEVIFGDLEGAGVVSSYAKKQLTAPNLGANLSGDQFFTDGKAYELFLK